MRELGINIEETAIMSAVIPVVAIIMPPVAGMIADKIGNFKVRMLTLLTNKLLVFYFTKSIKKVSF